MYLLDSDVFIDAKNRHYGFDIVPAFWDWLSQAHADGRVFTVERCAQEVLACPFHEIGGDTRFEMARVPVLSGKLGLATVQGSLSRKALCG